MELGRKEVIFPMLSLYFLNGRDRTSNLDAGGGEDVLGPGGGSGVATLSNFLNLS